MFEHENLPRAQQHLDHAWLRPTWACCKVLDGSEGIQNEHLDRCFEISNTEMVRKAKNQLFGQIVESAISQFWMQNSMLKHRMDHLSILLCSPNSNVNVRHAVDRGWIVFDFKFDLQKLLEAWQSFWLISANFLVKDIHFLGCVTRQRFPKLQCV